METEEEEEVKWIDVIYLADYIIWRKGPNVGIS